MRLWILMSATAITAYELNYVLRNETLGTWQLPPGLVGGWSVADPTGDRLQVSSQSLETSPGFYFRQMFLTNLCFTGGLVDPTNGTISVSGDNITPLSSTNPNVRFNLTMAGDNYWCMDTTLPPGYYFLQVENVSWWESITITFPVPASTTALSDDIVSRNLKLLNGTVTGGDLVINSDLFTIPEGSVTSLGPLRRAFLGWPNSSLTIHSPPGAAFFMLFSTTAPTTLRSWLAEGNCTYDNDLPWHPVNESRSVPMFTKGSSPIDSTGALVYMTPLNPSIRTNFTLSAISDWPHNFTEAHFYFVNENPHRNTTNNTSTSATIETATSFLTTATDANGAAAGVPESSGGGKSTPAGAIAGGVVGGVGGLGAIIGIVVFWLRRKRRPEQSRAAAKEDDMFVIEDNQPSLVPTPLDPPLPPVRKSLPPGAEPPELSPVFLKGSASELLEPEPFSKTRAYRQPSPAVGTSSASSGAAAPSESPRRRPRGPRFRNDVDAGGLQQVADGEDEDEDDTDSDAGTVLMPPTYDPRWRDSGAPNE